MLSSSWYAKDEGRLVINLDKDRKGSGVEVGGDGGDFKSKDRSGAQLLVESTTSYLRVPFVPCRIAKMWPGAKIVMLLR